MDTDTPASRSDALARASALANRARELRRAQKEVQLLTIREVQTLTRTAAAFFDSVPLVEFAHNLLPQTAKGLRRIRHRILHRTIQYTESGTLIRALLIGRDGRLRLFTARSADTKDLYLILEGVRSLPPGMMREVVDWSPTLRIPGFQPFEILNKLSNSLDSVEEQIAAAEQRVQVQKEALASGDLTSLLPARPTEPETPPVTRPPSLTPMIAVVAPRTPMRAAPASATAPAARRAVRPTAKALPPEPPPVPVGVALFDLVEAAAATVLPPTPETASAGAEPERARFPIIAPSAVASRFANDDEPEEWDDPI